MAPGQSEIHVPVRCCTSPSTTTTTTPPGGGRPRGSGRQQPGSLSPLPVASAAPRRFSGLRSTLPPLPAAALYSVLGLFFSVFGAWDLDVTGTRCVFAAGRQAPTAPVMAPVLRQQSPRSFRWHAKGSGRRKLAFAFRDIQWRIRIKEWKGGGGNTPTGKKTGIFLTTDGLTRVGSFDDRENC